jgi:hypothetical protein
MVTLGIASLTQIYTVVAVAVALGLVVVVAVARQHI